MSISGCSTWLMRMRFAMVSRRRSSLGEGVVAWGDPGAAGAGGPGGVWGVRRPEGKGRMDP